jgi:hypothetical protein
MKINTNQTNLSSVLTNRSTHLKSTLICIIQFILLLYLPESAFGQTYNAPCDIPVTDLQNQKRRVGKCILIPA